MTTAVKVRTAFATAVPSLADAYIGVRSWDHGSVTLNDSGAEYGSTSPGSGIVQYSGGANIRKIMAELYAYFNGESQYWTVHTGDSGSSNANMTFANNSQGTGERGFIVKSKTESTANNDARFLFINAAPASWRNEFQKKFRDVKDKGHDPGTYVTCSTYRDVFVGMDTACEITGVLTASAGNSRFSGLCYDVFGGGRMAGSIVKLKILETKDWFFVRAKMDYTGSSDNKAYQTVVTNHGAAYRTGVFCGKIESPGVNTTRNVVCGGSWSTTYSDGRDSNGGWGTRLGVQCVYEASAGRFGIGKARPEDDQGGFLDAGGSYPNLPTSSHDGTNFNLHKCALVDNYGQLATTNNSIMIGTFPCVLIGPAEPSKHCRNIANSALMKDSNNTTYAANMSGSFWVYDDGQVAE